MSTKRLELNKKMLDEILSARKMSKGDLAKMVGLSREALYYHLTRRTVKGAEMIAEALNLDARTLIQ